MKRVAVLLLLCVVAGCARGLGPGSVAELYTKGADDVILSSSPDNLTGKVKLVSVPIGTRVRIVDEVEITQESSVEEGETYTCKAFRVRVLEGPHERLVGAVPWTCVRPVP